MAGVVISFSRDSREGLSRASELRVRSRFGPCDSVIRLISGLSVLDLRLTLRVDSISVLSTHPSKQGHAAPGIRDARSAARAPRRPVLHRRGKERSGRAGPRSFVVRAGRQAPVEAPVYRSRG